MNRNNKPYKICMEDHISDIRRRIPRMAEPEIKNWIKQFHSNNSERGDYNEIIQELRNQLGK